VKIDYVNNEWAELLELNGLSDFDSLWQVNATEVDAPNTGRGGWSSVSRLLLKSSDGKEVAVYVKRQVNHLVKTWLHPISGVPTFAKEFYYIIKFMKLGIPSLTPVFFGQRKSPEGHKAILVTAALDEYQPLDEIDFASLSANEGRDLIETIAGLTRRLHNTGLQHNCLYPKHLFVRQQDGKFEAKFIDLEKIKWRIFSYQRMIRDLDTLNRHSKGFAESDKIEFLKSYLGQRELTAKGQKIALELVQREKRK